jgi:arylsulfatase A-like enzyme
MDSDIGRLMAQLAESRLDSHTLVLFASDNGPHKEGGHDPDFFNSSGPLNGIKRDLYEGGIRIPFLARWPSVVPAGTTSDAIIAFWDFLPTVAEVSKVEVPPNLDGRSFVPALQGRPQPAHEHLYWEFHERGFAQAVRMGNWKGVRLNPRQPIELYDLKADIGERENVAARHKDIVAEIDRLMAVSRTESRDFPTPVSR